jgi:hypothetical protein
MAPVGGMPHRQLMKKRAVSAILWFYSFWCVGAMIAFAFGLTPVLGLVLGTAAAAIFAGDPRGIIWTGNRDRS